MPPVAFMTANYVARETGWAMRDWGHGDTATQERFKPLDTYEERLDEIFASARALDFHTIDLWGAHLGAEWASDEHLAIAQDLLARHELRVAHYATWMTASNAERACELALGVGTNLIGAGFSGEPKALVGALHDHDVRLAVENHPEKTPAE